MDSLGRIGTWFTKNRDSQRKWYDCRELSRNAGGT